MVGPKVYQCGDPRRGLSRGPRSSLPHPHRKLSKKWADRAFALHQWSMHQGKPEQRINRVKELGYLFDEERPPAACDRLPN